MTIDGNVAVVTGAGSGIGAASAERLAAEGASVVCVDLHPATAASTVEHLGGEAAGHRSVAGDVADVALWDEVVAVVAEACGSARRLAVVHLNAGVYGWGGPIDELPEDLYRRTVGANIDGVVLGTRALVPVLRAGGGGAIVATASVAGLVAFPPNPIYTMTKHAVVGFVTALAPNLATDGIVLSAVCPGIVDTPMTVEALGGADPADLPMAVIAPADIADAVVSLATGDEPGRCLAVGPGVRKAWVPRGFAELFSP